MRAALHAIILFLAGTPLAAQMPPVGRIEVFGHGKSLAQVRTLLADLEGSLVSDGLEARKQAIESLPGVAAADIDAVCCDRGLTTLYVAVRGEGTPAPKFRAAPVERIRLPPPILSLGERFERALEDAVRRGVVQEDHSAGHAIMADTAARAVQEAFVRVAAEQDPLLRCVLATSSDAAHRALAAQILAYAPEKRQVVSPLLEAIRDPDPTVRNVAARALWLIAEYAAAHPSSGIDIPADPFIDLLESAGWTDRNKASMVLLQLTASRDSALLTTLRERAFDSLVDMARWADLGHAFPGVVMLGRIAGLPEEAIFTALSEGKKDTVIEAALRTRHRTS